MMTHPHWGLLSTGLFIMPLRSLTVCHLDKQPVIPWELILSGIWIMLILLLSEVLPLFQHP